ncbi:MAG: nucleotide exchange factor GrpE [Nitrososphaeria archaeon]|nr:nucleotide exchange factor GrpE [Nitrososphaeria archaeon]
MKVEGESEKEKKEEKNVNQTESIKIQEKMDEIEDLKNKVELYRKEVEEEKRKAEEYLTRLKYVQADYLNFRKRIEKEIEEIKKYSNERFIISLLEIVDELEMALEAGKNTNSIKTLLEGVEMTLKKLNKILENEGVKKIEALGKMFDPNVHYVIARIEKEDIEEGTILEEVRKGYIMKDRVIRPSIVKVAVKSINKNDVKR